MALDYFLRPVEACDARGINTLRRMPGVFENIMGIPSERLKRNEDGIANLGSNTHEFVAIANTSEGELLIGCAGLSVETNPRANHCASIGMMVHKDYQGMGVGTALLGALIDIADNWLMLVRVELSVFHDNERAIRLYERFGFKTEGLFKKARIRNGVYEDILAMARVKGS